MASSNPDRLVAPRIVPAPMRLPIPCSDESSTTAHFVCLALGFSPTLQESNRARAVPVRHPEQVTCLAPLFGGAAWQMTCLLTDAERAGEQVTCLLTDAEAAREQVTCLETTSGPR